MGECRNSQGWGGDGRSAGTNSGGVCGGVQEL